MNTIQILIVVAVVFLSTPTVFLLTVFILSVYYCKKEEREKMHHQQK